MSFTFTQVNIGNWLTYRNGLVPVALRHYISVALPLSFFCFYNIMLILHQIGLLYSIL